MSEEFKHVNTCTGKLFGPVISSINSTSTRKIPITSLQY